MVKAGAATLALVGALMTGAVRAGQPTSGPATIRGRVLVSRTGEALRGATVQATSIGRDPHVLLRATTDAQGGFELLEVPPGPYRVSASRTGFVTRQLGQRGPFETADPITVGPGQSIDANFTLTPGGAIAGRILDANGDSISGVRVQALRVQVVQGRRRLVPVGDERTTDDLGVYRVFGLPPGDYVVGATIGPETMTITSDRSTSIFVNGALVLSARAGHTSAYAPTYFPGTPVPADAHRISVVAAEDQNNVDFWLIPSRLSRVAGTVRNQQGEPIQARIELQPEVEGIRRSSLTTMSATDGSFELNGVSPGAYYLNVLGRIVEDQPPDVAWVPLDVASEELAGLTIITTTGSTVTGSVRIDGTPPANTGNLRIIAQPLGGRSGSGQMTAAVAADRFQLANLIGPYGFVVDPLPAGYALKTIVANGRDVTDIAIEFRGGDHVDVQVEVTNRLAELYGTVREDDQAVAQASVLVFPDDAARWTGSSRAIRTARTDQNGGFAIRGLLPDRRYLAVALEYLNDGDDQDAEFLASMKARATVIPASADVNRITDLMLVRR